MSRTIVFKSRFLGWAMLLWLVAEVLAYGFVLHRIGVVGALLIGIGSTIIGFSMLRRVGMRAVGNLRRGIGGAGPSQVNMLDGSLTALGAVFLILPGFLSDLVGLSLASPSVRQWIGRRIGIATQPGRRPARPGASTIDLNPGDWHSVDDRPRPDPRVTHS